MADKAGVQMFIAGTIPTAEALHGLIAAIVSEDGKPGWDEGVLDEADLQALIHEAVGRGEKLTFVATEKNGATMDEVEDACRRHGIAFQTLGDRGATWDSFVRQWQPGMDEPLQIPGGMQPSIELKVVRNLLAKGDAGIQQLRAIVEREVGPSFPVRLDAPPEVKAELQRLFDGDDAPEEPYAPRA